MDVVIAPRVQAETCELELPDDTRQAEVKDEESRLGRVVERSWGNIQVAELVIGDIERLMCGEFFVLNGEWAPEEKGDRA